MRLVRLSVVNYHHPGAGTSLPCGELHLHRVVIAPIRQPVAALILTIPFQLHIAACLNLSCIAVKLSAASCGNAKREHRSFFEEKFD